MRAAGRLVLIVLVCAVSAAAEAPPAKEAVMVPQIEGEWWTVARSPDLGSLSDPKQQPVDFSVWQAADGTWQLWSCIRNTKCGGKTRLFYRWEGKRLTDPDWRPMGIRAGSTTGRGRAFSSLTGRTMWNSVPVESVRLRIRSP